MRLVKSHGLGNDYLVLESGEPMSPAWAQALCHRHTGPGGDGVLEPMAAGPCDYGVRIWNPDGSVAEKSGNGLRIYARWLVDERGAPESFSVWTGACAVRCAVRGEHIAVHMGRGSVDPSAVPVRADAPLVDAPLELDDTRLRVVAVGVGNPHCVCFRDEPLDTLPWRRWGAEIEVHDRFPNRTNVQFARVIDRRTVEIRIWERGAGETSASGSSSCAVAFAAVHTGRCDAGPITVRMPGGALLVTVAADGGLLLEGPVERVGRWVVDAHWIATRS
jgi:diaminopimelate epimerase